MLEEQIQMVDLHGQYLRFKEEIDEAMQAVIDSCAFINGPQVKSFAGHLADYLQVPYVIPCGNGTDALQIALMALELQPGDEVILPAFTYIAAAEVVALLGLTPVLVDVDPRSFNIDPRKIEAAVSGRTKAIVAVHLFGQACDMEPIMTLADAYHLYVVEDNAQSIGADYTFSDGRVRKAGTIGHIGTTSFFPSKPLACYGDGGALMTSDEALAARIRMIANHGQECKYHHRWIGCNSRLDTLQAAVLDVKLKHLGEFTETRRQVASRYDDALSSCDSLVLPARSAVLSSCLSSIYGPGKRRQAECPSMPVERTGNPFHDLLSSTSASSGSLSAYLPCIRQFGRLHPFVRIRPFPADSYGNVPRTTAIYNRNSKKGGVSKLSCSRA